MKARQARRIMFVAEGKAELQEFEAPSGPLGPREVEGRTLVTLISAGTEMNLYRGAYHRAGVSWGRFPVSPGYAAVFEVERAGAEVGDVRPGDLCFCMGKHASQQRMPREDVVLLPAGLTPEAATFARLMNVTMSTLSTTTARPPERVLVTGLGLVGHLGARIFQSCGYEVLAVDPTESRRALAVAKGVRDVRERVPLDDPGVVGKVALVLECSAHEQAVLDGCRVVQKRGEVVMVGVPMVRHTEIYAQEIFDVIFRGHVVLRSGREWELPRHATEFRTNSFFGNMAAAIRWLGEGRMDVGGLWGKASPGDASSVYDAIATGRRSELAVILDWASL